VLTADTVEMGISDLAHLDAETVFEPLRREWRWHHRVP
jgi:hypothetical protein